MYSSIVFSLFTSLCSCHHCLFQNIFITPIRNYIPITPFFFAPSPWQPLIYLLSLQICLFWSCHIESYNIWNLWLASFLKHNVHPYCGNVLLFHSFLWPEIIHSVDLPHLFYPFIIWLKFEGFFSPLIGCYE